MMRFFKVILSLFISTVITFYCSNTTQAQSKELLKRIEIRERANLFLFEQKYDSIISLSKKIIPRDTLCLYGIESTVAIAYLEKGDTVNALKFLKKAIEMQSFSELDNLMYSFEKYKLLTNSEFIKLISNFEKLKSCYSRNINMEIYNVFSEIANTDTRLRIIWMTATDSNFKISIEKSMWLSDSMNIELMKGVFRKYNRYPGISDVGKSLTDKLNYIVGHWAEYLDRDTLYNYLKTATLNGQIPNWFGPRLLDKLEHKKGKPLIYAEFGTASNYIDDTFIYTNIIDIKNLDKRRAEFLLPPLYKKAMAEKSKLPEGYIY